MACLLIAALGVAGCARRNPSPTAVADTPVAPDADERRLWAEAEQEEAKIAAASVFYDDPLLEAYLARVGDRLTARVATSEGRPRFAVRVLRDPTLNAFALPNGTVYVHTGLLARLDDEAQLALILGRELIHVSNRHALRVRRDGVAGLHAPTVLASAVAIGAAAAAQGERSDADGLSPTAEVVLGLGLELAGLAAIRGYGRDLEREADAGALQNLVAVGYDPRRAVAAFAALAQDAEERGALETFFLGNRARLEERRKDAEDLLRAWPGNVRGEVQDEFALRTRSVRRDNAVLDIHAGRFALAQAQLDRVLAVTPTDPTAHLCYGDLDRLRAQRALLPREAEPLVRQALRHYRRAAELDPTVADPFRQLGFLYYQRKDTAHAREAFQAYLALTPDAPDARRIRDYLLELDR